MTERPHTRLVTMGRRGRCDLCEKSIERGETAVVFSMFERTKYRVRRSYHFVCLQTFIKSLR